MRACTGVDLIFIFCDPEYRGRYFKRKAKKKKHARNYGKHFGLNHDCAFKRIFRQTCIQIKLSNYKVYYMLTGTMENRVFIKSLIE